MNEDEGRKTLETRKDKTMKQNIGYQIDFVEGKIIVSKKFLKEASDVTTTAYSDLVQIRKDYPDFTIEPRQIAKKENKMTYGKLTYDFMEKYIKTHNADLLPEFYTLTGKDSNDDFAVSASYGEVRQWFLNQFDSFSRSRIDAILGKHVA